MAIHRLSGGGRAVELLGPDDSDILFRRVFSGEPAESHARALNSLRAAGTTVPLVLQSFKYDVIVRTFSANYANPWWIAYTLQLLVVSGKKANLPSTRLQRSALLEDISLAQNYLNPWPATLNILLQPQTVQDAPTQIYDA